MSRQHDSGSVAATLIQTSKNVHANHLTSSLSGYATRQSEIETNRYGVLVAETGKFTGRSPSDKFIVSNAESNDKVWWENTNAMASDKFDLLLSDMLQAVEGKDMFRQQLFAGAANSTRYQIDVWTPSAWHALFIRTLLIKPTETEIGAFVASATIVHVPDFDADPERHASKTTTCIALDFSRNMILICGTAYAGEIKKSVFSLFNYHAPDSDILPMHCSANVGGNGDTTLFFGLSGTGKTTLSTSADRALVGDDEHGWSATGIFNLEGGCYAKAINLTEENEPEIYRAARHSGAIMENVVLNADGEPDFTDDSKTENTRIAYPLAAIPNRVESGTGPTPSNIVLLTADAFGVLPPLAKLTREQAIYYFLSGYTAKVAGTERGVTEPVATFSTCFGAPFIARHPEEYGRLLAKRLDEGDAGCWLLNTGWTGGPYGVGERISLKATRRMLEAALSGELDDAAFRVDEIFGLKVPLAIEGVDAKLLQPELTWSDRAAYNAQANKLVGLFDDNFAGLGARVADFAPQKSLKSNAA